VGGDKPLHPKRIVRLPGLAFLKPDNDPKAVGYILAHMNTSVPTSLETHSYVSGWDVAQSPNRPPGDRLPRKLFSDPPIVEVGRHHHYQGVPSLGFSIGSPKFRFDFNVGGVGAGNTTARGQP
jgi:hypothetical protein